MTINPARQPAGVPVGGQFATMTQSEPAGVTLAPSPGTPDTAAFEAAREELLGQWLDADGRPEFPGIDLQYQRASARLAAAAVLRSYPEAETLVLWQNADSENHYDVMAVRDANGLDLADASDNDDWIRTGVGGENSVQLDELGWALDPKNDKWAEGIAGITDDPRNGKTAVINLKAAVQQDQDPAPAVTPRRRTNEAAKQYTDLADIKSRAQEQMQLIHRASQHASTQLLAACILEKHPTAARLHLRAKAGTPDRFNVISVQDAEGAVLEYGTHGENNMFDQYVPGGAVRIDDLVGDLDRSDLSWAEGTTNIRSTRLYTFAAMDLKATLAREAPAGMDDPKTRPLTRGEQSDLVEAAYYGLPEIEDAVEGAENNSQATYLQELHARVNAATARR